MGTEATAFQMPDVAETLAPERVREQIAAENAAAGIVTADQDIAAPTPTEFRYDSQIRLDGQPPVLEQVLNNELALQDLNDAQQARLENELELVAQTQSTLGQVISGELNLGDADRTALRQISLQLGNLYQIPPQLAHGMRLWVENERRGTGATNTADIQGMVADNYARVNNGGRVDLFAEADLVKNGLADGPQEPKFDPELEARINSGPVNTTYTM